MKVLNKVIVVTGGGNGMGRELVLGLLARGARVAAVDMNEAALAETATLAGAGKERLSTHVVNITDLSRVEALPNEVIAKHGSIDGLINNAGIIQPFVCLKDLNYDAIHRVIDVNFYGTLYMTKSFLPILMERPEAHIMNISSMGGFLPVPGQTIYGASKAAVKLMTEGLFTEMQSTNVHVTVVFPGAIGTNIAANSGVSTNTDADSSSFKMLAPVKAAQIMLEGMEKNRFRITVGSDAGMMDFLVRLNPKYAAKLIFKQMKSLLTC
jgi:short-subunit dehydrogenase